MSTKLLTYLGSVKGFAPNLFKFSCWYFCPSIFFSCVKILLVEPNPYSSGSLPSFTILFASSSVFIPCIKGSLPCDISVATFSNTSLPTISCAFLICSTVSTTGVVSLISDILTSGLFSNLDSDFILSLSCLTFRNSFL